MPQPSPAQPPLIVDLDGTLLKTDLLIESALLFLREAPLQIWRLVSWLAGGKATLKDRLANATHIRVDLLPFSTDVLALVELARAEGRTVVLATGSDQKFAADVSKYLGLFDEVWASDGTTNLSAERKRLALVARFGERGFDYIGNHRDDLAILASARRGFLVDPGPVLRRRAESLGGHIEVLERHQEPLRTWARALRIHQWLKNLLIFVPLIAAHRVTDVALWWSGALGFLSFGLCASSVYLLNDLLDLPDDRQHPVKRRRPLASGQISITVALTAIPVLLSLAFGASILSLPSEYTVVLALYFALTLAYSLDLKRRMTIDVIVLAGLYTLRIIAGAALFTIPLTFWILAFSMFVFQSLALVKRHAELHAACQKGATQKTPGRGYWPSDISMVASLGASSGFLAVSVLALYIHDESTAIMYSRPELIWLAVPLLLYWISRLWMLAHRGQIQEDPLQFSLRDRISLLVGISFLLVFGLAL